MTGTDQGDREARLWERYELSVHEMLAVLDQQSEVEHNKYVEGRLSKRPRQVDVLVRGAVVGIDITVVVECKHYRRPVAIGDIDQFIGKLLDIGADRGVLYSYSGFTNGAVARAIGAANPRVVPIALETPDIVTELKGVPGYPARLLVQEVPPLYVEDLDRDNFAFFLQTGDWSGFGF
jgi:Restriction endonuclease